MRRKLLLADDSVTIQRVIELTFADEDIDVVAVGDGDAAIARLGSDPPDIVLADTGMPGRDGYEVAAHVQKTPALAGIPVVLLTGALQPVDEVRAREAGCAGVLVKPFEPHMVISKVRELLERRAVGGASTGSSHRAVPDSTAGTPADAILNAPPSEHAKSSSPDDYFARLDAAFATLDAPPAKPREPSPPQAASAPAGTAAPPPASAAAHGGVTLADAFTALLALEQGRPAAAPGGEWSATLSGIIDEISRRVAEQVTDRVIRELAPEIVAQVAERVVREEMARLRQEAESSSSSSS